MDSIFAIALGLGIRLLVDVVSLHDFKVGGSLVGLWEGVVLYHFLRKMPKSFDPYVAYGFRLFVDFLFTESLYRMALVILWTALGMVLSDIAPLFWYDLGLRHLYRHFRRDVEMFGLPTLPFFSKTNSSSRVRFRSPSRASSVVTSARSVASTSSSVITPTNVTPHSTSTIPPAVINTRRKTRIIPGSFPDDWSETDADSVLDRPQIPSSQTSEDGSQHHDLHPIPETDESSVGSDPGQNGLTETPDDDDLLSEESSDSVDPSATDPLEIPEEDEEPIPDQKQDQDRTPTAYHMIPLPPTPAQSDVGDVREVQEVQPPLSEVPLIPDSPFVRDTFDTGGEEQDSSPPMPIPPVINNDPSPPVNDDPPSTTRDIPHDPEPPAYNEFQTDTTPDPTPDTKGTLPSGGTENEPPPTITVEPPKPTDNDPPNNDLDIKSLPPFISHSQPPSQSDNQPQLGDDLSPRGDVNSIIDSERPESMLPENTTIQLEQALTFRREAARIQRRILDVEGERKKAVEDDKSAIALLKSQEREGLEKEAKELNRKAERRYFAANNASSTLGKITVANLEPDEAVSRIAATLVGLLGQPQLSHGDKVELSVALGKKKSNAVKVRVRKAMKEHKILVDDGPSANVLIITLPKLDE